MKLLIEISNDDFERLKETKFLIGEKGKHGLGFNIKNAVLRGVPFEKEQTTAEWLEEYHYDYTEIVCSNCNKMFRYDFGGDRLWKYCPNCGSRMEGDNQCD